MGCIYCVTNIQNGKMYIGQAKNFHKRKTRHLYSMNNKQKDFSSYNTYIHRAMRKYGIENFSWRILEDNVSDDALAMLEMVYIDMFDTYNLGYNSTHGGEGSFGFRHTEENKQRIAESNRVRGVSEETKKKISESNKGKKKSDNFKKKLRESSLRLYSKSVLQYTLDGEFVKEWSNTIDATRSFTNKKTANIRVACIGKQRTAYGYIWKYKNNEDKDIEMYPSVGQYTLDNVFVHKYKNVFEAAEHVKVCASTLLAVCSGARPRAAGYIWKIIENENI